MIGSFIIKLQVLLPDVPLFDKSKSKYFSDFLPYNSIKDDLRMPITSALYNRFSLLDMELINCVSNMTYVIKEIARFEVEFEIRTASTQAVGISLCFTRLFL